LHHIVPLTLNGSHSTDERNLIINKFNTDPSARVLLFSNVGAVGLNLTIASIVVLFVSQPSLDQVFDS
jgi:SNF2 family DNA or RNA helicase